VDNDGDLDIYACRYVAGGVVGGAPVPYHNAQNGAVDLFWRNEGGHRFKEAAAEVGLSEHSERYGLALYFEDFDEDGWIDLYVVNDFGRNCLYKNEHGHFHDVAPELGLEDQAAGMGADMADADGDGLLDVYDTNMHSPAGGRITTQPQWMPEHPELRPDYVRHARGNTLLRARGDGSFEDVTEAAGVAPAGWAWGGRFIDWSNSGWPDIFVPNGFVSNYGRDDLESFFWREVIARSPPAPPVPEDYEHAWESVRQFAMFEGMSWNGWERNYAYKALGQGKYADVSAASGLDFLQDGRAAATIDWDDDGRLDLLLRNRSGPRLRLLLGAQETHNRFLELALSSPGPNRDAIGAQVYVEAGGRHYRQSVHVSQGFLCASSRRLHFGLGTAKRAERISIRWPDGRREEFTDVALDARYRVLEGTGKLVPREREVSNALDALPGGRVEGALSPEPRVVLFDELPLQPLLLPSFSGNPERVADHAGHTLLVAVGSWADPRSRALIGWLAKLRPTLTAAGCDLRLVLLDEASQIEAARRGVTELGLADCAGVAQQRFRQSLEVCLVEVLGPFKDLAQPLLLLCDRSGALLEFQSAPDDGARLLEDVRIAGTIDAPKEGTEAARRRVGALRRARSRHDGDDLPDARDERPRAVLHGPVQGACAGARPRTPLVAAGARARRRLSAAARASRAAPRARRRHAADARSRRSCRSGSRCRPGPRSANRRSSRGRCGRSPRASRAGPIRRSAPARRRRGSRGGAAGRRTRARGPRSGSRAARWRRAARAGRRRRVPG